MAHENPPISVAQYLKVCIEGCGKSQTQIAREVGFPKPNMVSMIKNGATQVPIAKVALLSSALGIDPKHLFRMIMAEYHPENFEIIEQIMGQTVLSTNELEMIASLRGSSTSENIPTDDNFRSANVDKNVRYTIDMDASARTKLAAISKQYKLTQGEVIEVMLAQLLDTDPALISAFTDKREAKLAARNPAKALFKQFKSMTPAQIEAALKAAAAIA